MAIKQRKQLTGTTAQINAYAGVEGQLVWDKTKKKWVGMSGTAGTNYPMASESHTHSISNVTNLQTTLNTINDKIPKTGNRGATAGFSTAGTLSDEEITISETSPDVVYYGNGRVTLKALPSADDPSGVIRTWTKSVYMTGGTVNIAPTWRWVGGETPELAFPCVLVCHAIGNYGIVGIVKEAS